MNAFEFATNSPWLAFFLALIVAQALVSPFRYLFRHLNIRKAGWPPDHCDADGDLIEKD
ncbi:hypothetical protein [Bosea sp. (in: a-proteobacteria)]|uniref:hypothetical protein n=1 Tax=Bosea sp. (in: a-proteobacteria) TaxID=1871050 RepID=UPI0026064E64|nr:hypothetical protein [Bosea sp. (in: a-proteobacteria)]MCO5092649.1 hypothetical protein [Bosea sp. (in: a-proteobacteria)]